MADVSGDRGQLVTVVAVVLAVALVATAMVANTVIFTENLATRETTQTLDDSADHRDASTQSASDALDAINRNPGNWSHAILRRNLSNVVDNRTRIVRPEPAAGGAAVDVEVVASTGGYRLQQTNASRNLTAGGDIAGRADWTLATGAGNNTRYWLNVSRLSLFEATVDTTVGVLSRESFSVKVSNGSATWRTFLFQGAFVDAVFLWTVAPGESVEERVNYTDSCVTFDDHVRVNFDQARFGGDPCDELAFYPAIDEPRDIAYNNTRTATVFGINDRVTGSYELYANNSSVNGQAFYPVVANRSPSMVTALTTAHVEFTYATSEVDYRSRIATRPSSLGAFGAGQSPPAIASFSVTDDTDTATEAYDFTVDVGVTDPDGDLQRVEFVLTDDNGSEVENATEAVGGDSDTASHRFQSTSLDLSLEDDGNFTVQATVVDATGRADSHPEPHAADGDDTGDPPALAEPTVDVFSTGGV